MFKFARYFFLVFILTIITPLVLLFMWNHSQMVSFKHKMDKYMLEFQIDKLKEKIAIEVDSGQDLTKDFNFQKLYPDGPILFEVYKGDKIEESNLLARIHPDMMDRKPPPPPFEKHRRRKQLPPHLREKKSMPTMNYQLISDSGEPILLFSLKLLGHPEDRFMDEKVLQPGYILLSAGLLLSLLFGLYINNNFVKPLMTISNGAKKIQQGVFSFELNTKNQQKEIRETLENFNKMIKGLKEKEELKNSFIENLSHDLRTPLIAQARALEMLAEEFKTAGMEDQFQLAKGLEKNNQHLLKMAQLILESYRIDSEDININLIDINLAELVNNCYEKLTPLTSEKNISLKNNIPEDFPTVKSDLTSLKRVFINLISNSVENIPEGSKVEIKAEDKGQYINIFIEDNGQGITKEDMKHIFDRYYSGKSDERKIGSGLGLYVCKKLLKLLNSEIAVESETGEFTRFIVKLYRNGLDFHK